jgi:DTW domain-containing protein
VRRHNVPAVRCPDCRLLTSLCLCADLPTVPARTRLVLVLHQNEERKSSNTGRLAVRCLPKSVIVAQGRLAAAAGLGREVVTQGPFPWQSAPGPCVLLFPDETARPIEEWRGASDLTLIVLDGTWSQAARARRRFPGLLDLPSAVVPAGPQLYALRYDPRPGRVGTMEAIARALGVLEGAHVQEPLEKILRLAYERTWFARGRRRGSVPAGAQPAPLLRMTPGAGQDRDLGER